MNKKIALVTGGLGGIGREICKALGQQGFLVISTFMRPGRDEEWQQTLAQEQIEAFAYQCDVGDYEQCQQLISTINQQHATSVYWLITLALPPMVPYARCRLSNGMRSFKPTSTRYLIPAN